MLGIVLKKCIFQLNFLCFKRLDKNFTKKTPDLLRQ